MCHCTDNPSTMTTIFKRWKSFISSWVDEFIKRPRDGALNQKATRWRLEPDCIREANVTNPLVVNRNILFSFIKYKSVTH